MLDEHEIAVPDRLKTLPGVSAHADDPRPGLFPMAAIFSSMLRAIDGEGPPPAPGFDQALHVHKVVEAAASSSDERRWVTV